LVSGINIDPDAPKSNIMGDGEHTDGRGTDGKIYDFAEMILKISSSGATFEDY
jgi:hypothetical protein